MMILFGANWLFLFVFAFQLSEHNSLNFLCIWCRFCERGLIWGDEWIQISEGILEVFKKGDLVFAFNNRPSVIGISLGFSECERR